MPDDPELEALRAKKLAELMAGAPAPPAGAGAPPAPTSRAWPAEPVDVTDASLNALIDEYPLVVVDCWAPWCGPCRLIHPIVEELAREMKGHAVFARLNTDENPATMQAFGIRSIPTLLVFQDGSLVDALVGALPKPQIAATVRRYMRRIGTPGPRRR